TTNFKEFNKNLNLVRDQGGPVTRKKRRVTGDARVGVHGSARDFGWRLRRRLNPSSSSPLSPTILFNNSRLNSGMPPSAMEAILRLRRPQRSIVIIITWLNSG